MATREPGHRPDQQHPVSPPSPPSVENDPPQNEEEAVDSASDMSFPASDPPALGVGDRSESDATDEPHTP